MAGFTLIELMIVVAIVAILARLAYPAYTNSIIKGKRAQGRAALLDLLTQQERYFSQNNSYLSFGAGATGNTGTDGFGSTSVLVPFKTWSGDSGAQQAAYNIRADVCSGTLTLKDCVLLTAIPTFSDTAAGSLTITSTSFKSCTGTTTSVCWN